MPRNLIAVFVFIGVSTQGLAQQQVKHLATFQGHVDAARGIAFSPDGKLLASGSDDQSIILWDLAQGKPRAVLEGHHTGIWNLAFSPDGKLLASGIGQPSPNRESGWDFTIKLWDVDTGKLRRSLEGCSSNVFSMAFSADGKYLAACHNFGSDNVKLWDVASGKLLGSPTRGGYASSLAFSNDGKLLAAADRDRSVELWDMSTGQRKTLIKLTADVTGGVSFSRDDKWLAVGTTQSVTLCDVAAGKEKRRLMEATFFPKQVLFSPDGKHLVAADSDWCSVTMWEVDTGKRSVRFVPAPTDAPNRGADGIAFSRDGALIASANRDSMVTVWRNPLSKAPVSEVKSGVRIVPKAAAPTPRATHKEREADFQWFREQAYPDARDHAFVRVYTNHFVMRFGVQLNFENDESKQSGEASRSEQQTVHGFLLEKKGHRFTVLTAGLAKETFESDLNDAPKERVRYEPANLKAYAAGFLKELRAPKKDDGWKRDQGPSRLQVFVLAWACWRRGFDDLAADLHHAAAQLPTAGNQLAPARRPLRELLGEELADVELRSIVVSLGRQNVSRAAILRDLAERAKRLPELANHDDVRGVMPLLRKMVDEDAAHAKNARPFAALSQREQIAELIFQLRDQGGYVAPSSLSVREGAFDDVVDHRIDHDPWPDHPNSPAQQLVKLGIAAAGQLIDHLDDERLTRSMAKERASIHDVLRVGDCAALVLQRVSGRKFKSDNHMPAETKRRILAWHAEIQKKGEKQTLIDGVSRGDEESYEQALRLMAKHSEEALAPIEIGIKTAKDDETRNWLLRAAGRLKGSDHVLLAELKGGSLATRLEAARILHRRGRPEAVVGMIALWNSDLLHKDNRQAAFLLADLAHTLIATHQPAAINAVAHDLMKRSVNLRQAVVSACASELATWDGNFDNPKRVESKTPAAARVALERILFTLLDDTEEDPSWSPSSRTCDNAAATFQQISATLYPFDPDASIKERDKAIRKIKNVWRQQQGQ